MKKACFVIVFLFSALLHAQIITTVAGNGSAGFSGEGGLAINAQFAGITGVAVDKYGNAYVAEWVNNVIEKVDTNGILTRFAGNGFYGLSGDNGPATAAELKLQLDAGIAIDTFDNVYFSDGSRVRKVNSLGIISTIAGTGSSGYSGDGGFATAAMFEETTGICIDKLGNIYVSDFFNSNVRKIDTSGVISTFAGTTTGGYSGDGGPATNAQFKTPMGVALDSAGNTYVADLNTSRVRKIDTSGIITTFAGGDFSPGGRIVCDGCPATSLRLYGSIGVVVDHDGNIFTSALGDNTVQKITKDGVAYTIAGNGTDGYYGDRGPASSAMLSGPKMICFDNSGNLLIADAGNHRIRKVWTGTNYIPPSRYWPPYLEIYPNPATKDYFTFKIITDSIEEATIVIKNILGQQVFIGVFTTNTPCDFYINFPSGMYFVTAYTKRHKITQKLVVQ